MANNIPLMSFLAKDSRLQDQRQNSSAGSKENLKPSETSPSFNKSESKGRISSRHAQELRSVVIGPQIVEARAVCSLNWLLSALRCQGVQWKVVEFAWWERGRMFWEASLKRTGKDGVFSLSSRSHRSSFLKSA